MKRVITLPSRIPAPYTGGSKDCTNELNMVFLTSAEKAGPHFTIQLLLRRRQSDLVSFEEREREGGERAPENAPYEGQRERASLPERNPACDDSPRTKRLQQSLLASEREAPVHCSSH